MPLPTRLKRWSAHALRYAMLLLFVFGGTYCATLDRASRTTAEVKGHYANAAEGCNGRFNHEQAGGHLQVRHESSSGFVATMTLSGIHGEVGEGDGDGAFFASDAPVRVREEIPRAGFVPEPPPEPYSIASVGFSMGQQTRYFGFELGAHLVAGPRGSLNEEVGVFPIPWMMLQLGNLALGWAEFRVGPQLGLADNLLIKAGAGFNVDNIRGTVGFGMASTLIVDRNDRDLKFNVEDGAFAVYGSIEWVHKSGFGLHVRVVTAQDFALSAGLVLELDTLFGRR